MVFEVSHEVDDTVCYPNGNRIFNTGQVVSIEAEIFVKVRDDETGEIQTFKPGDLYSLQAAKDYVDQVQARLLNLLQPQTDPEV